MFLTNRSKKFIRKMATAACVMEAAEVFPCAAQSQLQSGLARR